MYNLLGTLRVVVLKAWIENFCLLFVLCLLIQVPVVAELLFFRLLVLGSQVLDHALGVVFQGAVSLLDIELKLDLIGISCLLLWIDWNLAHFNPRLLFVGLLLLGEKLLRLLLFPAAEDVPVLKIGYQFLDGLFLAALNTGRGYRQL